MGDLQINLHPEQTTSILFSKPFSMNISGSKASALVNGTVMGDGGENLRSTKRVADIASASLCDIWYVTDGTDVTAKII